MSQQAPLGAAPTGTNLAKVSKLFPGWTPEEVDLARRTVAPDATEHELALFLRLCMTYGLDPFRKELVLEKRRRRRADGSGYDIVPVFITTRDAYLKAASCGKATTSSSTSRPAESGIGLVPRAARSWAHGRSPGTRSGHPSWRTSSSPSTTTRRVRPGRRTRRR